MRLRTLLFLAASVAAVVAAAGCNTTPTQEGAVVGGMLGAGLGAITGHQSGHQGEGALIGAGIGALTGALIGDQVDEQQNRAPQVTAAPPAYGTRAPAGHYENRVVTGPSGEKYELRVWVPDR
jgi:predicted lipid-binding transport protein (Tim44 family)